MSLARANVLLTGATGLIGGELLRAMLGPQTATRWALVRPTADGDAEERLYGRLRRSGVQNAEAAACDIRATPGDMCAPELNLSRQDHDELTNEVDIVIHAAAETSFLKERSCRENNITGTRQILDFVAGCRRQPLLVYISTAYVSGVIGNQTIDEDAADLVGGEHFNAYTRSKAHAERLVRESGLPVLILRPSIVLSAGVNDPAFARAILGFVPIMAAFGAAPIDPNARPDVVSVSFVVKSILALLEQPQRRHDCYHISAGPDSSSACGDLAALLPSSGRKPPPRLIPPAQWTRELQRQYVRTATQRKLFLSVRRYLPFINLNVHFSHDRLKEELGSAFPMLMPLSAYFPDLLRLMQRSVEPAAMTA